MVAKVAELTGKGKPGVVKAVFDPKQLTIVVKSHGLKRFGIVPYQGHNYSLLPLADLYMDCRGVREHGANTDRNDFKAFSKQIQENNAVTIDSIEAQILDSLKSVDARRAPKNPYKEPYTICFFCAWGMNRSPTTKHVIADRLKKAGYKVVFEKDPLPLPEFEGL